MKKKVSYYLILPLLISALVAVFLHIAIEKYFIRQAKEDVQNLILSNRGFHQYIQTVMHPAFFQAMEQGYIAKEFYDPQALSSTFIVRTMHDLYNKERTKRGMKPLYYKLAAYNPRNPINKADEWEAQKINFFNQHPTITEQEEIVTVDGMKYLYYAAPFLKNEQHCMRCHGTPRDAPVGLKRMYPGDGGFYEKLGGIRAIESMRIPIGQERHLATILAGSAGSGLFAVLALFLFNTGLRTRVREKTKYLELEVEERIRAEERARKNEENFRTIFYESPDAILLIRP
ncbi:MAG TPA: DUF3365 domain-containing protein, partial [Nitrospirota bacterium]|nr:DUF3365 domain-containing protein [Nitrospirota bacterium]